MFGIRRIGLFSFLGRRFQGFIRNRHVPRLAVEFEEDTASAVRMRIADGQEADDQRLPFLDFRCEFLACLLAVEENRRGEHAGIGILLLMSGELFKDLWIEQVREDVATIGFSTRDLRHLFGGCFKVGSGKRGSGASLDKRPVLENLLLHLLGKAAGWMPHHATEQVDDRFREGQFAVPFRDVRSREIIGNHEQGHVTHGFARRRDLDDVPKQFVDLRVDLANAVPLIG